MNRTITRILVLLVLMICAVSLPSSAGIDPLVVNAVLEPGDTIIVNKTIDTGILQAKADVVLAVDLTGSMGGALRNLKLEINNIINGLSASSDDLNVGIVSHEDYSGFFSYCGYSSSYGAFSDEPFRINYPVGPDFTAAAAAVNAMDLGAGSDGPESYARVMWEMGAFDNPVGFRPDAQKIVVMFLDNQPHDCGLGTGIDPGRDATVGTADDIDLEDDAIPSLVNENILLLVISNGSFTSQWDGWASLTGGSAFQINPDGTVPGGMSLTDLILGLIAGVNTDIWWQISSIDPGLTVNLDPLVHFDVPGDTTVSFTETVTVENSPDYCCADLHASVSFFNGNYPGGGTYIGDQLINIVTIDDVAPVISGVPPGAIVECDNIPPPASPTVSDDCDPTPILSFDETIIGGPCPDYYTIQRTWTARDRCDNETTEIQLITVQDTIDPVLAGVPGDVTVECDNVPAPASPTATDNCDPAPAITFVEEQLSGICPDTYTLKRTWTATDRCGNDTVGIQMIYVQDTTDPVLAGIPADTTVECDAVPLPASPSATDNCDPDPDISMNETVIPGDCPGNYTLIRTWTAVDRCNNSTSDSQTITVQDTTPPVVDAGDTETFCIWPPNHWYVCFDMDDFTPTATDNCSEPITFEFSGCSSDQPENAEGDGDTINDCIISADHMRVCVRAERQGTKPEGRHYGLAVVARDACDNVSDDVIVGYIYVPHDMSPHETCIKTTEVGIKDKDME